MPWLVRVLTAVGKAPLPMRSAIREIQVGINRVQPGLQG